MNRKFLNRFRVSFGALSLALALALILAFFLGRGPVFSEEPKATKILKKVNLKKVILEEYDLSMKHFSGVKTVSIQQAKESVKSGNGVFVDVRDDAERKVSIIPGAITLNEFELKSAGLYKGKTAFVYCTVGYRSALAIKKLYKQGIKAENLNGSILLWVAEGNPVHDPHGKPVTRVHTFGKQWDKVPKHYDAVY